MRTGIPVNWPWPSLLNHHLDMAVQISVACSGVTAIIAHGFDEIIVLVLEILFSRLKNELIYNEHGLNSPFVFRLTPDCTSHKAVLRLAHGSDTPVTSPPGYSTEASGQTETHGDSPPRTLSIPVSSPHTQ